MSAKSTRQTLRNNLIHFNNLETTGTVGIMTNPRPNDYNLRNRGPENTNHGTALAFTDFHNTGTRSVTNSFADTWCTMQVWVGIGGDLQLALQNGVVDSLSFDLALGLGALANYGTGASSSRRWASTLLILI